jgi:hypothetical protein
MGAGGIGTLLLSMWAWRASGLRAIRSLPKMPDSAADIA